MDSRIKRMILFLIVAVCLIVPDQITKQMAVEHLKDVHRVPIIKDVLYFLYVENQGAAFGVFQGAQYMFYFITIVVLIGILYVVYKTPVGNRYFYPIIFVAELVFAGAIGNFIDRVSQKYVVDFIYFSPIDFPVFNVADIYVTCGCIIMVFLFLFYYKDEDFSFLYDRKKATAKVTGIPNSDVKNEDIKETEISKTDYKEAAVNEAGTDANDVIADADVSIGLDKSQDYREVVTESVDTSEEDK